MGDIPSKKALITTFNYTGTNSQLEGCINDGNIVRSLLIGKHGYIPSNIVVKTDKDVTSSQNVDTYLTQLLRGAKQGDKFFFHYSGHGTKVKDLNGDEPDGYDEALYCPNKIISDDVLNEIVSKLPACCTLVIIIDACHSGTMIDLPYKWINDNTYENVNSGKAIKADIIMISGCRDNQTSADAYSQQLIGYYGALTCSIVGIMNKVDTQYSWIKLIKDVREDLKSKGFDQVPQLSTNNTKLLNQCVRL